MKPSAGDRVPRVAWRALVGACFCLLFLGVSRALPAQIVRGVVMQAGTGAPVPQSVVFLLDSAGAEVTGTWSDHEGHFSLHAPQAGTYRVRVQRIGFHSTLSPLVSIGTGEVQQITVPVDELPVVLHAVRVDESSHCVVRPTGAEYTATLWEEVRNALSITALTESTGGIGATLELFQRERLPSRAVPRREQRQRVTGAWKQPFVSAPAESLAAHGYVRTVGDSIDYFAPDAQTLLSPSFLQNHCLHARGADNDHRGMVGLAFEPVKRHAPGDVRGVLWLDVQTAELRTLEYGYTGMPKGVPETAASGEVQFQRLPSGAWIIRSWVMRTPTLRVLRFAPGRRGWLDPDTRAVVNSVVEKGGRVTGTFSLASRDAPGRLAPGAVVGTVFDSLGSLRLREFAVRLVGTDFRTTADTTGRFVLEGLRPGTYELRLSHPVLDHLGVHVPVLAVQVHPGVVASVLVASPSRSTAMEQACADQPRRREHGAVAGIVRTRSGTRVIGADVHVTWYEAHGSAIIQRERAAWTDRNGAFLLCDMAADMEVATAVTARGKVYGRQWVNVNAGTLSLVEIRVDDASVSP